MPTQEVDYVSDATRLLRSSARRAGTLLLDGGGADSWSDGSALFSHSPRATLEIFASGTGRWRCNGREAWRSDPPFRQWQSFLDGMGRDGNPSTGGFLTVLGYDLKHWIERLPRRHPWPATPILYCAFHDWAYRVDHRSRRAWIDAPSRPTLEAYNREIKRTVAAGPESSPVGPSLRPRMTKVAYQQMVERALDYIAAGDAYQINLAQRFDAPADVAHSAALFAAWRTRYPMPFAAYVNGGDWSVASNSPECLLLADGASVSTFPIKGTCAATARGDVGLLANAKECAEHVMIVDLERNDLGRVGRIGSIEVVDMAAVRSYPLVAHLVSEVRGTLRPDITLPALMQAMFPGGSITGAPKIRAMEIIEELEPCARGLYTGAIGWTDLNGRSRFNLAIRSAVFSGGMMTYHAGGGIVADSVPEREYDETLLKSEAFFDAWASMSGSEPCDRLASSS